MHRGDALYYEVLEMSLSDYESKKCLKVTWLPDGITKEVRLLFLNLKIVACHAYQLLASG